MFPETPAEDDTRSTLALTLDLDADTAEALLHPIAVGRITTRKVIAVINHLIKTGEVDWKITIPKDTPFPTKAAAPAAPLATPTQSLPSMSPDTYSRRPPKSHSLLVIVGQLATTEYEAGERDEKILAALGAVHRRKFANTPEMNAYIQGVEDAVGYMDSLIIEV